VLVSIGGTACALAVVGLAYHRRRRRRQQGARDRPPLPIFDLELERLDAISAELMRPRADRGHPLARSGNTRNNANTTKRTDSMWEKAKEAAVDQATGEEPTESRPSYAELGGRVASVLERAEEIAGQIRADAEEEAARIKGTAQEAAEALTRGAEIENTRLRKDAEDHAQVVRQTAEAHAEEMSKRTEAGAQQRKAELQNGLATLESRLERLLKGLGSMVGQTEQLLQADVDGASARSLVDALEVQRTTLR
jgi:F0F1-type ATP synthase membrane subunit b/b'